MVYRTALDLPPVVVSLTAIRSRISQLERVISSILMQSVPPTSVFLTVSEEPYKLDSGIELDAIPSKLREWALKGRLNILFAENTGPYRKLVPILSRYKDHEVLIATADDDTIYPRDWLAGLLSAYRRRQCIVAYRCRAMLVENGRFAPYSRWSLLEGFNPKADYGDMPFHLHSLFTLPIGARGILYNTRFFPDLDLVNRLQVLAPLQDDLAFRAATICAGIGAATVDMQLDGIPHVRFDTWCMDKETLSQQNHDENDIAWARIVKLLRDEGHPIFQTVLGKA